MLASATEREFSPTIVGQKYTHIHTHTQQCMSFRCLEVLQTFVRPKLHCRGHVFWGPVSVDLNLTCKIQRIQYVKKQEKKVFPPQRFIYFSTPPHLCRSCLASVICICKSDSPKHAEHVTTGTHVVVSLNVEQVHPSAMHSVLHFPACQKLIQFKLRGIILDTMFFKLMCGSSDMEDAFGKLRWQQVTGGWG